MKKIIITAVVVAALAFGWSKLSSARLDIGFLKGKTAAVGRGDLTIPITATGEIKPRARSEIKPEASGEVVEIPVEPGQLVSRGDLIIRLDPEDEQRNVTRATNDLASAKAQLEQERLKLEQARTVTIPSSDARIAANEAQLRDMKFRLDKTKDLFKRQLEQPDVMTQVQAQYDQLVAQHDGLLAERKQADITVGLAERNVTLAEKAEESAETTLRDAEKRLSETEIRAPIDGMISKMNVEIGEVVQSGRTTFTGGTVLAVVADISQVYVRTEVLDADIGAVLYLAPPEARPGGAELAQKLDAADQSLMIDTSGLMQHITTTGTPVKISVDSFRKDEFSGVIERIYPEPSKIQNIVTYLVDIRVTSPNRMKLALVLGMQADVEFTAQSVQDVLLIPHDAIRRGPTGDLGVYMPKTKPGETGPQPEFVKCRFGLDNGLFAELIDGEGIKEGAEVYTELPMKFEQDEDKED